MNTYEFTVILTVQVDAFDEADAKDIVLDNFGPGEDCGVEVLEAKITKE